MGRATIPSLRAFQIGPPYCVILRMIGQIRETPSPFPTVSFFFIVRGSTSVGSGLTRLTSVLYPSPPLSQTVPPPARLTAAPPSNLHRHPEP
jgi:hypothetical protein